MQTPIINTTQVGAPIPFLHFAFSGYQEPSFHPFYENLMGADFVKRCVRRELPPDNGELCREDPKACLWGEQTCPGGTPGGTTHPTTRCDCQDRQWLCQDIFLCPTIDPTCPTADPSTLNPAPICSNDLGCIYEEQTCCEQTFAKKQCFCTTGMPFDCIDIDVCTTYSCAIIKSVIQEDSKFLRPNVEALLLLSTDATESLLMGGAPIVETGGPATSVPPEIKLDVLPIGAVEVGGGTDTGSTPPDITLGVLPIGAVEVGGETDTGSTPPEVTLGAPIGAVKVGSGTDTSSTPPVPTTAVAAVTCPQAPPINGSQCSIPDTLKCPYGLITCSDESAMFTTKCECVEGFFSCDSIQACAQFNVEIPVGTDSMMPSPAPFTTVNLVKPRLPA